MNDTPDKDEPKQTLELRAYSVHPDKILHFRGAHYALKAEFSSELTGVQPDTFFIITRGEIPDYEKQTLEKLGSLGVYFQVASNSGTAISIPAGQHIFASSDNTMTLQQLVDSISRGRSGFWLCQKNTDGTYTVYQSITQNTERVGPTLGVAGNILTILEGNGLS